MTTTIPVYLYRIDYDDGETYHGTMKRVSGGHNVTLLGVATRPSGTTIPGAPTQGTFEENLDSHATDVRWFDEEMDS